MPEKWDEMTRRVWEKSEVMQEFEKRILDLTSRFSKLAKRVEAQNVLEQGAESAKELEEAVVPANIATQELVDTLKQNLSEDNEIDDDEVTVEITDEEYNEAKDALFRELESLAYDAGIGGDIKLAYKIERTLYDLEEEF